MRLILFLACFSATSALTQAGDSAAARAFFARYIEMSAAYDESVARLYSDSAVIRSSRRYPHGLERAFELSGAQWKELLVKAMPLAKARGDRSSYSKLQVSVTGARARIKADRYSALRCYTDAGYYMVVERQSNGGFLIVEEYSETQPQSNC